jgi:hypothetical protein
MAYKTRLGGSDASFDSMMRNGFGIVTVMNAKVYNIPEGGFADLTAYDVVQNPGTPICTIDTFKVANVTQEGPSKTVTGGQYSNPLIKFGKSARLEMQDALGRAEAIDALCGGIMETDSGSITGLHFGEDFVGPKMIIGDSFFIDRKSGQQVKVKIIFYQFLPDSIFNLTQDAEGDATVFDMNGDLLTTEIRVGDQNGNSVKHGVFYSIVADDNVKYSVNKSTLVGTGTETSDLVYYSADSGITWDNEAPSTITAGNLYMVKVVNSKGAVVFAESVIAA